MDQFDESITTKETELDVFAEVRGLARLRLGPYLALEVTLALRGQVPNIEFCDPSCDSLDDRGSHAGIVGGIGAHVTF